MSLCQFWPANSILNFKSNSISIPMTLKNRMEHLKRPVPKSPCPLVSPSPSPHFSVRRDRPHRASRNELLHDGVRGALDLIRRADLLDLALVQHGDPVRYLIGAVHVVGDGHRGHAQLLPEIDDQVVDRVRRDRVEPRGRLVVQDDLGVHGDCAGEAHALPRS